MAGNIKGIIVEIGGDTSGLQKALSKAEKTISGFSSELRDINKALKFDPSNVELLAQKERALNNEIASLQKELRYLKEQYQDVNEYVSKGNILTEQQQKNYDALVRKIVTLESQLKKAQTQASKWTSASNAVKNFSTNIGKMGETITAVGQKFMGLTATIGAGIVAGVKYNAEMETLGTNLKVLLGNEDAAESMLKTLKQMAATTPFETTDLVGASKTLLSFGVEADKVNDILTMLGDVSMGNKQSLESLALVFGQISANGKLTGQDLLQLVNVGFNPLQTISEQTGESMESLREKMSKGQITIEDVSKAFQIATSEGGRFYKGMEEGSKTLTGKASTALDGFKEALGGLTESLLLTITKTLEKFTELINKFNELDDGAKQSIMNFSLFAAAIAPVLIVIGKLFTAIKGISAGISVFITWIPKIKAGLTAIGTAIGAINLPLVLIVGAIVAVIAVLKHLWDTNESFRTAVINAWTKIKETLLNIFTSIGEFFTVTIPKWIENIKTIFSNLPYYIGFAFGLILGKIVQFGIDAFNWIRTELPKIINSIIEWFKKLPANIWTWLTETLKNIGQWIANMMEMIKEKIPAITQKIISFFKELPGKMLEIGKNIVEGLWNGIKNAAGWIGDKVKEFATGILDGMKSALGIHSPSTLFRDEVGRYMAEGIGVGFIKNLSGVIGNMKNALLDETGSLNTNVGLTGSLNGIDGKINSLSSGATSNVINLTINPQSLTEAELDNAFNYINKRFGLAL